MGKSPILCVIIMMIIGILFIIGFIPPASAQNEYGVGWEIDAGTLLTNFITDPFDGFLGIFPAIEWNANRWKEYADTNAEKCKQYSDTFYERSYDVYVSTIVPKYNIPKESIISKSFFKTNLFESSESTVASQILSADDKSKQYFSQYTYYCHQSAKAYDMAMGKTSDSDHTLKAEIFSNAADVYRILGQNSDANKLEAAAAEQTAEEISSFGLSLPPWIIILAVIGAVVLLHQKKSKF